MEYARGRKGGQGSAYGTGTFTGDAMLDPVLAEPGMRVNSVVFSPGGRTFWHSHAGGQVLMVSSGRGMVETRDGDRAVLEPGDAVWAPPGEVHWHGAAPGSFLAHTAISIGETTWEEEVTEDHYQSAAEASPVAEAGPVPEASTVREQ
jgi:quercetin dioxygenase-like cupin family protein